MKTRHYMLAVATLILAACNQKELQEDAPASFVGFDTYTAHATKAGASGEIISKEDLQVSNFGVFGYYHNGGVYTAGTSTPDFMWNQKVEFDGDKWIYTPVKYWPNESGGTAPDCVSFFAYAPYVEASTAGAVTPDADGITGIVTLNNTPNDPILSYKTPTDPLQTVDLLWGVVSTTKASYTTVDGSPQAVAAGLPNLNLTKQTKDEKIMFQFKHALAKLTLDVMGYFDEVPGGSGSGNNNVAKDTKIVVEYVKLSTTHYGTVANLNLNNTVADTPRWGTPSTPVSFTIEGTQLTNLIRYRTPSAADKGYVEQPRGVTNDPTPLMASEASKEAFFGIIPVLISGTTATWTAEIKYHVFTKDDNLNNGYSEIVNVIKDDNITLTLDPGKHYTLRLRLGMTSVKFDATVGDWIDGGTTSTDLPVNAD